MKPEARMKDTTKSDIIIRPLRETEISSADSIMRLAFGTFIGLPDPMAFMGDAPTFETDGSLIHRPPLLLSLRENLSVQILQLTGAASASLVH